MIVRRSSRTLIVVVVESAFQVMIEAYEEIGNISEGGEKKKQLSSSNCIAIAQNLLEIAPIYWECVCPCGAKQCLQLLGHHVDRPCRYQLNH